MIFIDSSSFLTTTFQLILNNTYIFRTFRLRRYTFMSLTCVINYFIIIRRAKYGNKVKIFCLIKRWDFVDPTVCVNTRKLRKNIVGRFKIFIHIKMQCSRWNVTLLFFEVYSSTSTETSFTSLHVLYWFCGPFIHLFTRIFKIHLSSVAVVSSIIVLRGTNC